MTVMLDGRQNLTSQAAAIVKVDQLPERLAHPSKSIEIKDRLTNPDAQNTTRQFHDCIPNAAMAIRGKLLRKLQQQCAC